VRTRPRYTAVINFVCNVVFISCFLCARKLQWGNVGELLLVVLFFQKISARWSCDKRHSLVIITEKWMMTKGERAQESDASSSAFWLFTFRTNTHTSTAAARVCGHCWGAKKNFITLTHTHTTTNEWEGEGATEIFEILFCSESTPYSCYALHNKINANAKTMRSDCWNEVARDRKREGEWSCVQNINTPLHAPREIQFLYLPWRHFNFTKAEEMLTKVFLSHGSTRANVRVFISSLLRCEKKTP
jgi:hypothetical protein